MATIDDQIRKVTAREQHLRRSAMDLLDGGASLRDLDTQCAELAEQGRELRRKKLLRNPLVALGYLTIPGSFLLDSYLRNHRRHLVLDLNDREAGQPHQASNSFYKALALESVRGIAYLALANNVF